jgi:hypothetical protein
MFPADLSLHDEKLYASQISSFSDTMADTGCFGVQASALLPPPSDLRSKDSSHIVIADRAPPHVAEFRMVGRGRANFPPNEAEPRFSASPTGGSLDEELSKSNSSRDEREEEDGEEEDYGEEEEPLPPCFVVVVDSRPLPASATTPSTLLGRADGANLPQRRAEPSDDSAPAGSAELKKAPPPDSPREIPAAKEAVGEEEE